MTDRELRATIRQRFIALRAEVQQRRTELITETEAQLFERYRVENERADELDRGLKEITDEANRKAVALLREFEDLADGGRWKGGRQAVFEVPRIHRSNADRTRLHRVLMAEIDNQTQQALRVLDRQQTTLLRAPDRARTCLARGIPAIVSDLITPARLRDVEARLNAAAMT
ncbi:MAG: hypothetical protein ACRDRB_19345 [Pseudonocardiaceae bacterium]